MVHSSAMTQISADLMEKHCNQLFRGRISWFRSFDKHVLWPPRYLEDFSFRLPRAMATQMIISNLFKTDVLAIKYINT